MLVIFQFGDSEVFYLILAMVNLYFVDRLFLHHDEDGQQIPSSIKKRKSLKQVIDIDSPACCNEDKPQLSGKIDGNSANSLHVRVFNCSL